jgi:hypothetical protein
VQAEVQEPATQYGSAALQSLFDLQPVPGFGTQTPLLLQVEPVAQPPLEEEGLQVGTQLPSSQTSPVGHWLVNLQTVVLGSQEPETHWSPLEQSLVVVQGQGPLVPPQVTQALW